MRFLLFVFLFLISATQLFAKTIEVEMWTNFNGEKKNQRYEPLIVSIDEGDTVIWKSVEKSHNVEFMTGGVPEGVGEFKSEISQDAEYTFTIPGIYAYICSPHKTGKMLGFVIVGNDKSNLDDIKALKYRGMSKKFAKRKVEIIECRMHEYPKFAEWSMYRENESSFFENVLTQQIIFMFNKKEYVITVACTEKCEQTKNDLFQLVETIKF